MICRACQCPNPDTGRFCRQCGATLAAATTEGKTVLAPSPGPSIALSPEQRQEITRQAERAFGTAPIALGTPVAARANQREHTFFVNDVSSSMASAYDPGITKEEASIRAAVTMVLQKAHLDPNDEIGIVTFNSKAQLVLRLCPLHSHRREIIARLQSLTPSNGTDINEGLMAARDAFDWSRKDVVRRIILLTDGQGGNPQRTAEDLKAKGVVIDVIGVGDKPSNVNETLLKKVASTVEGELRYRFIKDHQTLVAHYTQLASKTATGS